MHIKKQK